jgi:sialic acid synthase SpsE
MSIHLFDHITVYGDIGSNAHGSQKMYEDLVQGVTRIGAVPKVQLFDEHTFDRSWPLPPRFCASVFRPEDVDYVMQHDPSVLKVASVESTHFELIQLLLTTEVPLIISTGGMDEDELLKLLDIVQGYEPGICLMHCVAKYPTPLEECNMHRISTLADVMDDVLMVPWVGWSCHTPKLYTYPTVTALTQSATQLEYHVMMNKTVVRTKDEEVSLQLADLEYVMALIKRTVQVLGTGDIEQLDREDVLGWRKRWEDQLQ